MDQVTQILLGSTAAQAFAGGRMGPRAAVVGAVAGFAPDLDVLAKPLADPLFPMEVHRTFTHSFAAVPVGALLIAALFLPWPGFRRHGGWLFVAAFVAWLSHAPLDACTSYGTMLLWPFDRTWFAWDLVAIVDPLFSAVLLVGLLLALRRRRVRPAWIALGLALLYLGVGAVQRERALDAQERLATSRGETIEHGRVIPRMGALLFWRSLYRTEGAIRADQLRLPPFREAAYVEGGRRPAFTARDLPRDLPDREQVGRVFARWLAFSDGFAARLPETPEIVGDVRYSLTPGFAPVWGVRVEAGERPVWVDLAALRGPDLERFLGSALGTAGVYAPLPAVRAPNEREAGQ